MDPALERRIYDFYAAFGRGDVDGFLELFDPDVKLINPEYAIDGGVREGRAGVRAALTGLNEQFAYERIDVEQLEEGPDGVVVVFRMVVSGRASGARLDQCFAHVFRFRGELVFEFLWFRTLAEGRRAVGLE
jgi:ketosteroid isomerase-like protein